MFLLVRDKSEKNVVSRSIVIKLKKLSPEDIKEIQKKYKTEKMENGRSPNATHISKLLDTPRMTRSQAKSLGVCMNLSLEMIVPSTSKINKELAKKVPRTKYVCMKSYCQ